MNMSHRGRALSISEKQMVVHVKHYFDKEKELFLTNKKLDVNNSAFRTALATHLSQVTVWRIMAEYHSNNSFSPPAKKALEHMRSMKMSKQFVKISSVRIIFVESI